MNPSSHPPEDILTVDLEDWFHILEVEGGHAREDWDGLESRALTNTERLLTLFSETGATATFFVVGWLAWRHPGLARRIASAGHEVASHSFWHEVLARHDRASLVADLRASKEILEDQSGRPVQGFRAPGWSIRPATAWVFDVLAELGFRYDSSLSPGYASHGGFPTALYGPHRVRCNAGELTELPATTVGFGRWRIPYAGGGYLRLLPYPVIRRCARETRRRGDPMQVYVHPREIDPEQPRMSLPPLRRFKYYVGLRSTEPKLRALLREHRFVSAAAWLAKFSGTLEDRVLDVRREASREPRPDPARIPPLPPTGLSRDSGYRRR